MANFFGLLRTRVCDVDGEAKPYVHSLFLESTTAAEFIDLVDQLHKLRFDLNSVANGKWTVGRVGLSKGEIAVVHALDAAGYNFALDGEALDFAQQAWHGSLYAAVAASARRHDPFIVVPSLEVESAQEFAEIEDRSIRGVRIQMKNTGLNF